MLISRTFQDLCLNDYGTSRRRHPMATLSRHRTHAARLWPHHHRWLRSNRQIHRSRAHENAWLRLNNKLWWLRLPHLRQQKTRYPRRRQWLRLLRHHLRADISITYSPHIKSIAFCSVPPVLSWAQLRLSKTNPSSASPTPSPFNRNRLCSTKRGRCNLAKTPLAAQDFPDEKSTKSARPSITANHLHFFILFYPTLFPVIVYLFS